jgi:hypothetical protein
MLCRLQIGKKKDMAVMTNCKVISDRYNIVRICRPAVEIMLRNGSCIYNYEGDPNENDRTNIKCILCKN